MYLFLVHTDMRINTHKYKCAHRGSISALFTAQIYGCYPSFHTHFCIFNRFYFRALAVIHIGTVCRIYVSAPRAVRLHRSVSSRELLKGTSSAFRKHRETRGGGVGVVRGGVKDGVKSGCRFYLQQLMARSRTWFSPGSGTYERLFVFVYLRAYACPSHASAR